MKTIVGFARSIFLGFFISHIPATVLLDGQASGLTFPYPQFLVDFLTWYSKTLNDPLFAGGNYELWFQSFIGAELVIQLPYFFLATYMLSSEKYQNVPFPEWFRIYSIVYIAQVVTSMIPILASILFNPMATLSQRGILSSIYMPYLIVPLSLLSYVLEPSKTKVPVLRGATKVAMFVFFVSHIPITIFLDSQALGTKFHPQSMISLIEWYAVSMNDNLMKAPSPLWFQCLVLSECCVQLPYFFFAVSQLLRPDYYNPWFPSLSILYGSHVLTTLIPILVDVWFNNSMTSVASRFYLSCVYAPYVIFPAWIAFWGASVLLQKEKSKEN
jgi:EXPERA (EXPanded EBP superfamily)